VELANLLNTAEAKLADQEHQLEKRGKAVAAPNTRVADGEHKLQQSEEALTEANAKLSDCEHQVLELPNSLSATESNLAPLQCEVEQRNATMGAANAWLVDSEVQLLEQRAALNSTDPERVKLFNELHRFLCGLVRGNETYGTPCRSDRLSRGQEGHRTALRPGNHRRRERTTEPIADNPSRLGETPSRQNQQQSRFPRDLPGHG
jgi:hypothetical protein